MFYKIPLLKRRIKKAKKAETLQLARTPDGEWLTVAGGTFILSEREPVYDKLKGCLYEEECEPPEAGSAYRATKMGKQIEMINERLFINKYRSCTELPVAIESNIIIDHLDTHLRMYVSGSEALLIADDLTKIADPDSLSENENDIRGPYLTPDKSIIWTNHDTYLEVFRVSMEGTDLQESGSANQWIREAHAVAAAFGAELI